MEDRIKLANMEKDIQYIKKSIDELNETIKEHIACCDTKYANKWVEKVIIWGMQIVGGLILVAIVGLVIIKK